MDFHFQTLRADRALAFPDTSPQMLLIEYTPISSMNLLLLTLSLETALRVREEDVNPTDWKGKERHSHLEIAVPKW